MSKASSTLTADVGPLACMYPHVLPQVGGLREGFVTHCAGVRFETEMDILVSPQTARVLEGLWTSVTRVWAFSCVLAQVILVVRTPFKSKGAVGTQEGTHSSVDTLVDLERNRYGEISHL